MDITQKDKTQRRHFTKEQKRSILNELDSRGMTISVLSRRYDIHPIMLYKWRRQMHSEKKESFSEEERNELLKENEELKKKVEKSLKNSGRKQLKKSTSLKQL